MAEPNNTPFPPSTPVSATTPRAGSPVPAQTVPEKSLPSRPMSASTRPVELNIGDPVKYHPATSKESEAAFNVILPSAAERERLVFIRALENKR
ncbi:hypothetical protein P8C59_003698 [Phyllachora maydis]|uniref:Uncharacterized protein n=1 Tax=Phyllachora maydis TaxID=1825666 RepID=A0AAD9MDL1_9PEZI|nr:hypothetical protein P8C59_003698 [Phyllachora maydis]